MFGNKVGLSRADGVCMDVLILGGGGLLGRCLARDLAPLAVQALPRAACDIQDKAAVTAALRQYAPRLLINAAGFLNVDRCEREPEASYAVNALGVASLIAGVRDYISASAMPLQFLHFSTDFVFDGEVGNYTETALPHPLSRYGQHKALADAMLGAAGLEHFWNLRIASVVGFYEDKPNFIKNMVKHSAAKPQLEIVDDLRISITTTEFLAEIIRKMLFGSAPSGLYHAVAGGVASWHALASLAFQTLAIETPILAAKIEAMKNDAPRPRHSDLQNAKLAALLGALPSWQEIVIAHLTQHRDAYLQERAALLAAA